MTSQRILAFVMVTANVLSVVEGFGFVSPTTRSVTSLKMSTKDKQPMTSDDESILFGESPSTPNPPFPARHRHVSKSGNLLSASNLPINPLDHSTSNPLVNSLRRSRDTVTSCCGVWADLARLCPDNPAVIDEHMCDEKIRYTFKEMDETIRSSAGAFQSLGVEKGVNVAILAENSAMWLIADHGIELAGGASAVRGADAPLEELRYIYEHSESKNLVVLQGPKLMQKLMKDANKRGESGLGLSNEKYGACSTVILLNREKKTMEEILEMEGGMNGAVKVHVLSDLLKSAPQLEDSDLPKVGREDLATIVYTSGTTGKPKGVMLTHGNLLHQVGNRIAPTKEYEFIDPMPTDTMLSLLPVWHITERTFELWILSRGGNIVYSSIRSFKADLAKFKPHWMVLVPRVLEKVASGVQLKFTTGSKPVKILSQFFTKVGDAKCEHQKICEGLVMGDAPPSLITTIKSKALLLALSPLHALGNKLVWSKVQDGFGGRQKAIICGGSALPGSLETFYETAGIPIIVGYGLTECSPLIAHRRYDSNFVTAGCVGLPTLDTEIRVVEDAPVVDNVERKELPVGEVGVVTARGPQIMKGYYKNKEATDKAVDKFGWFDTGDLGRINPLTGDLILTGRAKDTIVLSNGENIEPSPIEDAIITESKLIEQIMVTGQDGRSLVAIVVLNPAELVHAGFIDTNKGDELLRINEQLNNPQCTPEQWEKGKVVLEDAAKSLRANEELTNSIKETMRTATAKFRPWEQPGAAYLLLEPFAMVNGLLTQSYKVKRDSVMTRYGQLL